jgi:hypothetical protein
MANKPPMTEDEFIAELLRRYPELKVEVLPNGKRVIRGIRLKASEEQTQ